MSDLNLETEPGSAPVTEPGGTIFEVPIAKGGKDATVRVVYEELSDDALRVVIAEGLKSILNSRMSKVGATTKMEGDELSGANAKAMEIAAKNLADLQSGALGSKSKSKAKSELPREIQTEAMRIARAMVKDAIRAAKGYPSTYAASEITAMAKKFIEVKPEIVKTATENVSKRKALEGQTAIDVLALGKPDPKLEAKRAEAAAKRAADAASKPLSAKQAGKTKAHNPPPPRRSRGDAPSVSLN